MRFLFFDRVTLLEPGKRIEGVKNTSITEEYFRGHFSKTPIVPGTMLIESMIQLLAWASIAKHDYQVSTVLTILEDVDVPTHVGPGQSIRLVGELRGTSKVGAFGSAYAEIDGRRIARVGRAVYAHAPHHDPASFRAFFAYMGGIV